MADKSQKEITLFTNSQMWYHMHIIHFMFLFIITGLPLVSEWFWWLAFMFGVPFSVFSGVTANEEIVATGIQVCRIIHRFTAVLWILLSIPFVINMLPKICSWGITPRRRKGQSWSEYVKEGLNDTKAIYIDWQYPKYMGKYNLAQIAAAWAVIFICLVMLFSGCILWFRTLFDFSPSFVAAMRVTHFAGFACMVLFLIFHIYFAVHPVNKAGYKAMFRTGTDTVEHAKKKHPGLFDNN